MKELHDKSANIDILTVHDRVKSNEIFNSNGGIGYLLSLSNLVASAICIEKHAMILREKEVRRNIINDCLVLMQQSYDESIDIDDIIKDFSAKSDHSSGVFNESTDVVSMRDAVMSSINRFTLNQEMISQGGVNGVTTGSFTIDNMIGRFQPGNLAIIAARPGMGKTAFALNMAISAANECDPVVIVSLEMMPEELVNRLIVRDSIGIRSGVLKNTEANDTETKEVHRVSGILERLPITFIRNNSININKLKTICRKLKKRNKLKILIVDYLQLMRGDSGQNREQEIAKISRELKTLANELMIPVVALSQLNRTVESRADKTPQISDLRESGAIEQDADMIFLLNRPAKYGIDQVENNNGNSISSTNILVCDIAKQRNGDTGDVLLVHNNTMTKIWDYDDNPFKNNPF